MGNPSVITDSTPTKTVIRRWKGTRDLIALFPEEPAEEHGGDINSYMHVGQHGAADYDHVISQTKPVLWWDDEYEAFLGEMVSLGYNLAIYQRRTPEMRKAFYAEQKRQQAEDEALVAATAEASIG